MASTKTHDPTTQEPPTVLPPEESRALFDRKARALLGISGPEFLRRWDAGEYRGLTEETREERDIMRVAMLIPFGRR
jgi:hypothetical protein